MKISTEKSKRNEIKIKILKNRTRLIEKKEKKMKKQLYCMLTINHRVKLISNKLIPEPLGLDFTPV
jgi:hypothetical protein